MATDEKSAPAVHESNGGMPDHLRSMGETHDNIDVIHASQKLPYGEIGFIGTYIGTLLNVTGSFAMYIMPATALALINEAIGPSPNATWVALAWTLLSAVSFTLGGRLSDIFGRRWFVIGSNASALIGCIIGATANYTDTLIAASVFLGAASAGQLSLTYVIGELVPVRHRFAANGFVYLATLPTAALGPWVARLIIVNTPSGWRGIYYLGIGITGTALLLNIAFYHPPRFEQLHRDRTKMQELAEIDFGGIFLFIAGAVLFLLGLSWGGQLYPWKSAYVLATLIIGFLVLVAFVLYEIYVPLRRPLVPMHLWNYGYTTLNILSAVGGIVYYSMSLLWPTMVAALFVADVVQAGLVSCSVSGGLCAGQFIGAWIAVPGGHLKYKMIFVTASMTAFLAGLAGATDNQGTATALAVLAGFMVGLLEVIVSTAVTVVIDDQSEIGAGAGLFGSIRAAFGVIATAIYTTILQNKVSDYTSSLVVPAVLNAGLPEASLQEFLLALASGSATALQKIPGVDTDIILAATTSYREAYAQAFKIVYLATIAFGGLSFIASFFVPDIDDKLSHDVVRRLNGGKGSESESDVSKGEA